MCFLQCPFYISLIATAHWGHFFSALYFTSLTVYITLPESELELLLSDDDSSEDDELSDSSFSCCMAACFWTLTVFKWSRKSSLKNKTFDQAKCF